MQQLVEQLTHYIRGMARFRWQALIVAWIVCALSWVFITKMDDKYLAYTKFKVDPLDELDTIVQDHNSESVEEKMNTLKQDLLSDTNMEAIIRQADLHLGSENIDIDALIQSVQNKIKFNKVPSTTIYTIEYESTNKKGAKNLVQALLDDIQAKIYGEKRNEQNVKEEFIDDQIRKLEEQLRKSEFDLAEFKKTHMGRLPEQGKDYFQRLSDSQEQVRQCEVELRQYEHELASYESSLERHLKALESSDPNNDFDTAVLPGHDERIASLNSTLDELLLKYTDDHPDVVNTKSRIAALEKRKKEKLTELKKKSQNSAAIKSPVVQNLKGQIVSVKGKISSKQVLLSDYRSRVKELKALVEESLEVERQFKDLNRNYSQLSIKLTDFQKKKLNAETIKDKNVHTNDMTLSPLDAPGVSPEPVWPNRTLFYAAALIFGIGAGVAFAFLLSQLSTSFFDSKSLSSSINMAMIGTVATVLTPEDRRIRLIKRLLFGIVLILLLCVFGMFIYTDMNNIPFPFLSRGA